MLNSRQKQKLKTRKKILTVAFKLFDEKGYEKTSYADIAAKADLGYGTIYSHFSSKEYLLLEIMYAQLSTRIHWFNKEGLKGRTPLEQAQFIIDKIWEWDKDIPLRMLEAFYAHRWHIDQVTYDRYREKVSGFMGLFLNCFKEARSQNLLDKNIDINLTVRLLSAAYFQASQDGRFNQGTRRKAKDILDQQFRYLLRLDEK